MPRWSACREVVAKADKSFGRVDILVNAAAITDRGTILDTSPELFDRMFAINVRAPFFLMQDAAQIMRREQDRGTVVNILSMSAQGGQPFLTAYCARKGALATLTKNAAFALMPDGIRVNGLNIGWMDTPGEDRIQMRYHDAQDGWLEKAEAGRRSAGLSSRRGRPGGRVPRQRGVGSDDRLEHRFRPVDRGA